MEIIIRTEQPATVSTSTQVPSAAPAPPPGAAEQAALGGAQNAGPAPTPPGEGNAPAPAIAASLAEPGGAPGQSAGGAPTPG